MSYLFLMSFLLQSQSSWLLASDKIWAVMAVVVLIFGVLIWQLFSGERKLRRLEQTVQNLERKESKPNL